MIGRLTLTFHVNVTSVDDSGRDGCEGSTGSDMVVCLLNHRVRTDFRFGVYHACGRWSLAIFSSPSKTISHKKRKRDFLRSEDVLQKGGGGCWMVVFRDNDK